MGENPNAKRTTTFPWLSQGVQATDHQTCAPGDQKQTRAAGNHELKVETDLPERPQTFAEGLRRRSSSSTDVSRAGVEIPPALSPPAHPPAKPTSNRAREKTQFIHSFSERPDCEVCRRTKVPRKPCRRNPDDRADSTKIADGFDNMMTADHKILNEDQESIMHHKYAMVVQDLATRMIHSYPCKNTSAQETTRSLRNFRHPEENPISSYTDNLLEFIKACEELNWNHERPALHGIAERTVRRVKEGPSSVLVQSGLQESWWAEAMERHCYL